MVQRPQKLTWFLMKVSTTGKLHVRSAAHRFVSNFTSNLIHLKDKSNHFTHRREFSYSQDVFSDPPFLTLQLINVKLNIINIVIGVS